MSKRRSKLAFILAASLLFASSASLSQEPPSPHPAREMPEISKTAPDIYKLGTVEVDARKRLLTVPAKVNMQSGLVELLASTTTGKLHESVLVVDVDPLYLQLGLLLLGLEPGGNPSSLAEDPQRPGDMMDIWVEWKLKEQPKVKKRAEELILDLRNDAPMQRTPWVFLGSRVYKGRFLARELGSLITTYHDSTAIVENPLPSSRDDTLYEANPDTVPPVGTPVTLIISPVAKERSTK